MARDVVATDEDWRIALETNLLSAVRLDRALLPRVIEQGRGAIVHMSSIQWKRAHPSSPAYGPAQAALGSLAAATPRGNRARTGAEQEQEWP
jgi:NAD(P)-dependent dehydrogenase (short-subunit alcohol dehydrogenase family)